jgi:cysteine desulfurase family protein
VYREASEVERAVQQCRARLAALVGAEHPSRILFTFNATDALNLALHGLLVDGDHVVTTVVEHNSVLRPLRQMEDAGLIDVTRVRCDGAGLVAPEDIRAAITPRTRLIALIHASNVTGTLQPVAEVGRLAAEHDCLYLVDAAQTLGHVPVDVRQLGVHLLASAGHKGLLGPLGSGLLYVAPGVEQQLRSVRQGGTGTDSDTDRQPDSLPEKYESGNLNVPALVGLAAGVEYIGQQGSEAIGAHHRQLTERMLSGFSDIPGLEIHGPGDPARQVGVVSITLPGYDPRELAGLLDAACGIQVRPGIHCAPGIHAALGTLKRGGTVRFSFGPFTTPEDVDHAVASISEIGAASLEF